MNRKRPDLHANGAYKVGVKVDRTPWFCVVVKPRLHVILSKRIFGSVIVCSTLLLSS